MKQPIGIGAILISDHRRPEVKRANHPLHAIWPFTDKPGRLPKGDCADGCGLAFE
jgi:hypothetical protein